MTQMMDCSEARLSLGVYVLCAIDAAERAMVDSHLADCRDCRDELARLALLARVNPDVAIALAASGEPPASEEDGHAPPGKLLTTLPSADSASMMARILLAAKYQVPAMTQLASYRPAVITQHVGYEAEEIRDAAKREADRIMQSAVVQASAVREAAEMEAAEVRQALLSMETELSDLATRIANTLPNPVLPRTPSTERSPASPAATPSTQPKARPHTAPTKRRASKHAAPPARKLWARPIWKPRTRPVRKPIARSAKNAAGAGRQAGAMRFAVIASSALLLFAVVTGVTEISLHGFAFFIFRSVGTGETGRGPGGLLENQGPGQSDAPKATNSHVKVRPTTRSAVTVRHNG
jgi:hypothetical protein